MSNYLSTIVVQILCNNDNTIYAYNVYYVRIHHMNPLYLLHTIGNIKVHLFRVMFTLHE